jgi:hypothetical protein
MGLRFSCNFLFQHEGHEGTRRDFNANHTNLREIYERVVWPEYRLAVFAFLVASVLRPTTLRMFRVEKENLIITLFTTTKQPE